MYAGHQVGSNVAGSQNLSFLGIFGLDCRRVKKIFSRRRRVRKKFIAFFTFYDFLSVKKNVSSKFFFNFFWNEANIFLYGQKVSWPTAIYPNVI
jgi:hypothetical protein